MSVIDTLEHAYFDGCNCHLRNRCGLFAGLRLHGSELRCVGSSERGVVGGCDFQGPVRATRPSLIYWCSGVRGERFSF